MKTYKLFKTLLLSLFLLIALFGCSTSENEKSNNRSNETLDNATLDNETFDNDTDDNTSALIVIKPAPTIVIQSRYVPINIEERTTYSVNASVNSTDDDDNVTILYESADTSIADVSNKGVVTIKKAGIVKISMKLAENDNVTSQLFINAYKTEDTGGDYVAVKAIYAEKTYATLAVGDNMSVFPSVRPTNATNKSLGYLTTDETVAIVNDAGYIEGLSDGNATIIIYSVANPEKYTFVSVDVAGESINATKLDLDGNPLSLIGKYRIDNYQIDDGEVTSATSESNLRVNVNLNELGNNIVKILMYINLNGKEAKLIQSKDLSNYSSIGDIFTSLGAEITGDYTMTFTLSPENYTEIARQGLVNKGETLVINITKSEDLVAAAGLGDDIEFDEENVAVEGENTDWDDENASSGSATETETETEIEEEPEEVETAVEKIELNFSQYSAVAKNEQVQLVATISPNNATNQNITWISSNSDVATVDNNGLVTILKNGKATITATSDNGVSASMNIIPATFSDFKIDVGSYKFYLEQVDTYTQFQITYTLSPDILDVDDYKPTYSSRKESVATVDENGLVKAVSVGDAEIVVEIEGKTRTFLARVYDADKFPYTTSVESITLSEESVTLTPGDSYNISSFITVLPEEADTTVKYESSNESVATVNQSGLIKAVGVGQATITITSYNNADVSATFNVLVETYPDSIVFERFDYGVPLSGSETITPVLEGTSYSNSTITYSIADTSIAEVDKNGKVTGKSTGSTTLTATLANGTQATTTINVYTPITVGNASSLQGTYEIIDFTQYNGTLNVGTSNYGGVQRMIGEMTIEVDSNNQVSIKSKIQMDSTTLNNFTGVMGYGIDEAHEGQFQYTDYTSATYSSSGFGTAGETSAKVTHYDTNMLQLYQSWNQTYVVVSVNIQVNTWIKKKSDTVKDLKSDTFHYTKNCKDQKTAAFATNYWTKSAPDVEPYYTYGVLSLSELCD